MKMSKFTLLVAASGLVALSANAQYKNFSPVSTPSTSLEPIQSRNLQVSGKQLGTAQLNKTAAGGSRWYNYAEAQFASNGLTVNDMFSSSYYAIYAMWSDSSVYYSNSVVGISYQSFGHVLQPQAPLFNDAAYYQGLPAIKNTDAYTLDSFAVSGIYSRVDTSTAVDTLIFAFTRENVPGGQSFSYGRTDGATTGADHGVDSFAIQLYNKADYGKGNVISQRNYNGYPAVQVVKLPLTAATLLDTLPNGLITLAVPVGMNVAAGGKVAASVTYRSGRPNNLGDALVNYNYFAMISHETSPGGFVYYDTGDNNMSSVVTKDTTKGWAGYYIPSLAFGAGFVAELHNMDWKLTCTTCLPVGLNDVASKVEMASAYPNPANNEVNVPFTLKQGAKNVTVTISNLVGQQVAVQNFNNLEAGKQVNAKFNTSNLSNGMYIYTIAVDGVKASNRFVVSK